MKHLAKRFGERFIQ